MLRWLHCGILSAVLGAEVRLLSLQGLQHPVGKCLRVVRAGHEQGECQVTGTL